MQHNIGNIVVTVTEIETTVFRPKPDRKPKIQNCNNTNW